MIQWPAQTEPVLWGAVAGAVILSVVGFSFSGWHTASQTDAITSVKVATALTAAMAPVCALAFKQDSKYAANMVELKKTDEWSRSNLIDVQNRPRVFGLVGGRVLGLVFGRHVRLGLDRRVDAVVGQVEEERRGLVGRDELHRLGRLAVGEVFARRPFGERRDLVGRGQRRLGREGR